MSADRMKQFQSLFVELPVKNTAEISKEEEQRRRRRRQKKNKYEQFSKIQQDSDPFQELLAESKRKLTELEEQKQQRAKKGRVPAQQQNQLQQQQPPALAAPYSFPDTKGIDPYDPSTFGYLEIGYIVGAHGVEGWLKVQSTTDFPLQRLCTPGIRHIKPERKRAPRQIHLIQGKHHRRHDEYLIQLENIHDRENALQYKGSILYVRQEDKVIITHNNPSPQEVEEYLVSDLVGLQVRLADDNNNEEQTMVGLVSGLVLAEEMCAIPGLGHDTLEVTLNSSSSSSSSIMMASTNPVKVLIPLVRQIVVQVNIQEGYLVIDPPLGLLDLTYEQSPDRRVRIKGFLPPATKQSS